MNRELREKLVEDFEDLASARASLTEIGTVQPWYRSACPGLVTGAADDDPSGIGTYSANGAQFGYVLLWLVPLCIPLMIAVQEMCGRLSAITGDGLAAVIKAHYPRWLLFTCVGLLVFANVFNVYADLNVMAASSTMLLGTPFRLGLLVFMGFLVVTQILIPYRLYARVLKWLCLSLLGYVVVAFMPGVKNNWASIAHGLVVPHLDFKTETILAIVAFLGTTISPYLFFWQAGQTVEEEIVQRTADEPGYRTSAVTNREIRNIRADTVIGMIASQLVALFIVVAASGTLHATGLTHINTAQDAARALRPLGPVAYWIFSVCMIGTGLLAIPTLAGSAAYAVAETCGWRSGLYRRFDRAQSFYVTVAVVILVGCVLNFVGIMSPIKALVYSAALNGIIAPPLIVVLLLICNNSKIMGNRTNGRWSNFFSVLTVGLMGTAAVYLVFAMLTGLA
ncbi:MAG: Nramp family divalent metal transporter [Fimbriimonas sp.]|nr:Nramp family divalent metal transporter [Fimbriimonas sp.]